jgi:hypothetical protein
MDRPKRYLSDEQEAAFPHLRKDVYEVTSDADWAYNCVAHAAGKTDLPWWPVEEDTEGIFWPAGVDRAETADAFVAAFRTVGYRPCEGPEDGLGFIVGFEKVVLYVDAEGAPVPYREADRRWSVDEQTRRMRRHRTRGSGEPRGRSGRQAGLRQAREIPDTRNPRPMTKAQVFTPSHPSSDAADGSAPP